MSWLRAAWVRLAALFRPRASARQANELDEEIQTHLELLAADYERRGLDPGAARAAARREFGGASQVRDAWTDQRTFPIVENVVRDFRQGARALRRHPGPALTGVLSLAIAVGGATAVYGVIDAVFFAPLSVARPHELVIIEPQLKARRWILPNPVFERLRDTQRIVIGPAAFKEEQFLRLRLEDGTSGFVQASVVSGAYFSVLDIKPAIGRLLSEDDDRRALDGPCAVVISHGYWARQFASDPSVLGRTLRANQVECAIVGVTPPEFSSHLAGYSPDLFLPLRPFTSARDLDNYFGAFFYGVIARLPPRVSQEQAAAALTDVYREIHRDVPTARNETPIDPADVRIRLSSGAYGLHTLRAQFGSALTVLMALVGAVVILAAVNVANIVLARGVTRRPELITRRALGAGPFRLLTALTVEGAIIVGAGTIAGLGIATVLAPFIASFVTLSYQTIAVSIAPSLGLGLVVGTIFVILFIVVAVLPAYRLVRSARLVITTRSTTGTPSTQRSLRSLVAVQLGLSFLLVAGGGLLVRTMIGLSRVDPGLSPDRVMIFGFGGSIRFEPAREGDSRARVYRDLETRLRAVPGVEAVALSWLGLFGGSDLWIPIKYEGQTAQQRSVRVDYVTAGYFDTVGMRLVRGRFFEDDVRVDGRRAAVVNEAMARQRFDGEAIGRQFVLDVRNDSGTPFVVTGVVADSKYNDLRETAAEPMMWLPLGEVGSVVMRSITVRAAPGAMNEVVPGVRRALQISDPELQVRRTSTLSALISATRQRERLLLGMSVAFGGVSLLLAALGVYGTLAQAIAQRRRELGVRLALGARPGRLRGMVLKDAGRLVLVAMVIALPVAIAAGGALQSFLFEVTPGDPPTLLASALFVAVTALVAADLPARRAAAVDPVEVIRGE